MAQLEVVGFWRGTKTGEKALSQVKIDLNATHIQLQCNVEGASDDVKLLNFLRCSAQGTQLVTQLRDNSKAETHEATSRRRLCDK